MREMVQWLLKVQPQQLLMLCQHPQFDCGFTFSTGQHAASYTPGSQRLAHTPACLILAADAEKTHRSTERGNIQRHIGGTSGSLGAVFNTDHGHGCLGRQAIAGPRPVTIQHYITNNEHRGKVKRG
jgi:hypothetical protein